MSLANKYRPKKLKFVYGNDKLKSAVEKILRRKKDLPQTYILQGMRGCGKTTMARIMAREFGAIGPDLREINIGDMRGIDTARNVIRSVKTMPLSGGKSKCIILNEVHSANKEFQNAMLEVLEEPPRNVYFILCTTNPEALLDTVLSRCTLRQYSVGPLTRKESIKLINRILRREDVEWGKRSIVQLSKISDGVPREILINMDAVIDLPPDDVEGALSELQVEKEKPIELARAISKAQGWKEISRILRGIDKDAEGARYLILEYFRKKLLSKGDEHTAMVLECFEDSIRESGLAGLALACYKATH